MRPSLIKTYAGIQDAKQAVDILNTYFLLNNIINRAHIIEEGSFLGITYYKVWTKAAIDKGEMYSLLRKHRL